MINKILLICDDIDLIRNFKDKMSSFNNIFVVNYSEINNIISKRDYDVVVIYKKDSSAIKIITEIKKLKPECEIILYTSSPTPTGITNAYKSGIFDYITPEDESFSLNIKISNCFKKVALQEKLKIYKMLLSEYGITKIPGDVIKAKYLKEIFPSLLEDEKIRRGTICLLTLEDGSKTKKLIKNLYEVIVQIVQPSDLVFEASGGMFYVILKDAEESDAQRFLNEIQNNLPNECRIRAGIRRLEIENFDVIDKDLSDSLQAAKNYNKIYYNLSDNGMESDAWLGNAKEQKHYKLFLSSYRHKLLNIIEPAFFNYQKSLKSKIKKSQIIQYANDKECVFSIKSQDKSSELKICYNGYTKLNVQIIHKGLGSAENTKKEISLKDFNKKDLNALLKQLKEEYIINGES